MFWPYHITTCPAKTQSTGDIQAAEETQSTRADDCIPAADEIARATTSVAPEENVRTAEASTAMPEETDHARATASVVPEEMEPISSAPLASTPSPILPSASEAKKTKVAEHATVKKRKASTSSESSATKKMKKLTSSFENPIDDVLVSSMPSKERVPFDEEYVIPSGSDEDIPYAASSEQLYEEIEVDKIPSTPTVSSPMPQFTAEEADVEEMSGEDENVDIGCTMPVMNDDFWGGQHPNYPLFTPLQQIS